MVLVQIEIFEKLFYEDEITEEEGGERIRELKKIMGGYTNHKLIKFFTIVLCWCCILFFEKGLTILLI